MTYRWSIFSASSILIWFHQLLNGGPDYTDNIYSNFNTVTRFSIFVQAVLTILAGVKDKDHPTSYMANILTVLAGTGISFAVDKN